MGKMSTNSKEKITNDVFLIAPILIVQAKKPRSPTTNGIGILMMNKRESAKHVSDASSGK